MRRALEWLLWLSAAYFLLVALNCVFLVPAPMMGARGGTLLLAAGLLVAAITGALRLGDDKKR